MSADGDNYEVGYGRPPRHTRFRKGRSGNPKGRPRGTKDFAVLLFEEGLRQIVVREGVKTRRMNKREALVASLYNRALKGDIRAIKEIINFSDRPHQPNSSEVVDAFDHDRVAAEFLEVVKALRLTSVVDADASGYGSQRDGRKPHSAGDSAP